MSVSTIQLAKKFIPSLHRGRPRSHSEVQNVVIVHWGNIGDFILFSPVLRAVRENFPHSRISCVVQTENAELAKPCPYVDEWIFVRGHHTPNLGQGHGREFGSRRLLLSTYIAILRSLRRNVDLLLGPEWLIFPSLQQVAENLLFTKGNSDELRLRLTAADADGCFNNLQHQVPRTLGIIEVLGLAVSGDRTEIWLTEDAKISLTNKLTHSLLNSTNPIVTVCLGAGQRKRDWTSTHLQELIHELRGAAPECQIAVTGPLSLRGATENLNPLDGNLHNLVGSLDLQELGWLIRRSAVVVSNDSAPAHMAAALGIPVVVVSAHPRSADPWHLNSPKRYRPWSKSSVVLQPASPAPGCSDFCRAEEPHCVLNVSLDSVVQETLTQLRLEP